VDNTSDADKPVSTAQGAALGAKLAAADLDTATAADLTDPASATRVAGDAVWEQQLAFMSPVGQSWDGMIRAAAIAAERVRIEALFDAANTGTLVGVGRRGTSYDLYQELLPSVWWRATLAWDATAGGEHHSLLGSLIGVPMLTLDQTDGSFAYSATGWATSSNVNTYGGTYTRNSTTGATCTWTTPTATSVGLRAYRTTNGGYALVTLDASATAATLLPSAQDEVDAGRLAATALVAAGGTLNPTDRLYNSYGATSDSDLLIRFAEGLTSAAHTVVLTVTGYKQATSTDVRLYISGGIYAVATTTITTAGMTLAPLVTPLSTSSVYEYAITYTPTGGTLYPFIGNRHGNDIEDTFAIAVGGTVTTLTDGQVVTGALVTVARTTHLRHPDTGTTNVGTTAVTYTMRPGWGMDVQAAITWLVAGIARASYLGMLPTQGAVCTKGRAAGGPVVTLTDDDGSSKGSTRSDTVALWQDGGRGAVMLTMRNLPTAVNRWAGATTNFAWLEDRTGGDFNKGYFQRVQTPGTEAIVVNDVWATYATYRAAWMTSTAALAT
jgi:hypothetical protein